MLVDDGCCYSHLIVGIAIKGLKRKRGASIESENIQKQKENKPIIGITAHGSMGGAGRR